MADNRKNLRSAMDEILGQFPFFSGDNEIDGDFMNEAIDQAVYEFSRSVPRVIYEDEVGDDGRYYDITMLTSWEDGFSEVLAIDYDTGTRVGSDEEPNFLNQDDNDWKFYRNATANYIYFPHHTPSSSVTMTFTYTARHTVDDTSTTVDTQYDKALLFLSVANYLLAAAVRLEKSLDPPAGAEFVTMRTKSSGIRTLAETYYEKYVKEMGGMGVIGASAQRDFDQKFVVGEQYLFHSGFVR